MKATSKLLLAIATLGAACGGGSDSLPPGGTNLLELQIEECPSAQLDVERFNRAAAILAASDSLPICVEWPADRPVACQDAYAFYSQPFAGNCLL